MTNVCPRNLFLFGMIVLLPCRVLAEPKRAQQNATPSVFAKENLVAWCIVPFDAKKRTPSQRAEMLKRLGLTKVAYDWRAEHVPTFEEEILAYKNSTFAIFAARQAARLR